MTEPGDDANPPSLSAVFAAVIAFVAVVATVAYLGLRDDDGDAAPGTVRATATTAPPSVSDEPTAAPEPAGTRVGPCTFFEGSPPAKPVSLPTEADLRTGPVQASIVTNQGTVELTLDGAKAPCGTASFVSLARQGYFEGAPCQRILGSPEGSFAQCGDPTGTGSGGPGYTYAEENLEGATYPRGTVALANTGQPNSSGGQFFLVTQDFGLQPDYTVLGTITGGLDVLEKVIAGGIKPGTELPVGGGEPVIPLVFTKVTTTG